MFLMPSSESYEGQLTGRSTIKLILQLKKVHRTKGIKRLKKKANRPRKAILHPKVLQLIKAKAPGSLAVKIDIKYNDEYDFTGRIYMLMETYDKKDVIKSDFYTYFNNNKQNAGIELKTVDPKDGKT